MVESKEKKAQEADRQFIPEKINNTTNRAWGILRSEIPAFKNVDLKTSINDVTYGGHYRHPETPGEKPAILMQKDWTKHGRWLNENWKDYIDIWKKMSGITKPASDEFIATFILAHEADHYLQDRNKTPEQINSRIQNETELFPTEKNQHRLKPAEKRADRFAASFIKRHKKELGGI